MYPLGGDIHARVAFTSLYQNMWYVMFGDFCGLGMLKVPPPLWRFPRPWGIFYHGCGNFRSHCRKRMVKKRMVNYNVWPRVVYVEFVIKDLLKYQTHQ